MLPLLTLLAVTTIPVFSFPIPIVGNVVTFSGSPLSTGFLVDTLTASSVFESTSAPTFPFVPITFHYRGIIQISSTAKGMTGIGIGDAAGSKIIVNGIQNNGYAAMYERSLPNGASANDAFTGFISLPVSSVGTSYEFEIQLTVATGGGMFVTGNVQGSPNGTAYITDMDLLHGVKFYAIGNAQTDVVQAYDNPFLF
jgi:hypothetical protein